VCAQGGGGVGGRGLREVERDVMGEQDMCSCWPAVLLSVAGDQLLYTLSSIAVNSMPVSRTSLLLLVLCLAAAAAAAGAGHWASAECARDLHQAPPLPWARHGCAHPGGRHRG
jgi:hypothetical protein